MENVQQPWFPIGSCQVNFGWTRGRLGGKRRLRFLLLGPFREGRQLRPTIAAGDIAPDGEPVPDYGAVGPDQAAAIAGLARHHFRIQP